MITFPNKPKEFYIARLQQHMDADELIRNVGYKNGRGCAVGCILDGYIHSAFEGELGLPKWFAYLIDMLHENTSDSYWPTFAMRLLCAVPVGVDVEPIHNKILIFVQLRNLDYVKNLDINDALKAQVVEAIEGVMDYLNGGKTTYAAARAAAARAAAARAAARAAAAAAAARAARAAAAAAAAATRAAYAADAADGNYDVIADELIKLLEELE